MPKDIDSPYLRSEDAARFLRLSPRTLEGFRVEGRGPRFLRFGGPRRGRVLYRQADLEAWSERSRGCHRHPHRTLGTTTKRVGPPQGGPRDPGCRSQVRGARQPDPSNRDAGTRWRPLYDRNRPVLGHSGAQGLVKDEQPPSSPWWKCSASRARDFSSEQGAGTPEYREYSGGSATRSWRKRSALVVV